MAKLSVYSPKVVDREQVGYKPCGLMSKGQHQRLHLAAFMSLEARLYLLDEPLAGIDLVSREKILETLSSHLPKESAMILTTHEIKEVESLFSRLIYINDGRITCDTSTEELISEGSSASKKFIELNGEEGR